VAVDIDYSTNNGGGWISVVQDLSNSGSYSWTVPGTPTNQALVRVKARDAAGGTGTDPSNAVFTIADHAAPVVAVLSPAGGESWDIGSAQEIAWTASDDVGVDSVNVDYSLHGLSGPWLTVAHRLANSGTYSWTVPYPPTDSALVRVTAFDHAGNSGDATSSAWFQIVSTPAGAGSAGSVVLDLARPRPNPCRGEAVLRFSLPQAGRIQLEILDPSGRRVWSAAEDYPAGAHALSWHGEAAGGQVGTGVYFVRLSTPWGVRGPRLVWIP
jgi:hypothetical protein